MIVTLGGECAVSVAPFAQLAHRYGDDLASRADVVGITVAEVIPRQVMHLQQLLTGFLLLRPPVNP